jgi:hypothetical protein
MQPEVKWLMDYFDQYDLLQDMQDTIDTLMKWSMQNHGYASKNVRLREWNPDVFDITTIVYHLFAACQLYPEGLTYQAMIGYISSNVKCDHPLDRAKCAAEVIAIAHRCELIVITKTTDITFVVTTNHRLAVQIPVFMRHVPEFKRKEVDYVPILGGRLKKHQGDVCLDHIERMNAIPLVLETRIIDSLPELPNKELDTVSKVKDWEAFREASRASYDHVREKGQFFLRHHYDTRGRTYCEGYFITYQGTSFKKAIVQLAQKEKVKL